jgi:hypothetical protein
MERNAQSASCNKDWAHCPKLLQQLRPWVQLRRGS